MILYNTIGQGYNDTRKPDFRIVDKLIKLLNLPTNSIIADIGAGTGNYSNAIAEQNYQVVAIEPSVVMQSQKKLHSKVRWLTASAEKIPLADNAVDGAIVMLALHHFQSISEGIQEINRIVNSSGKIIIFAFEQSQISDFWLTEYFPYFICDTLHTFPSTSEIATLITNTTQRTVNIIPFLLPQDLSDRFAASGWFKPEIYLDLEIRNGISSFAKMPQVELQLGLKKLTKDIESGAWSKKYGYL